MDLNVSHVTEVSHDGLFNMVCQLRPDIICSVYVSKNISFLRLLCHNCWTINHAKFVFLSYDFANLILTSKTIAFQISMRKNISEILTACLFEIWKKKTAQNFYIITISIYY